MQAGAQPVSGGTQVREQLLATHGRAKQSHVRNGRLGEDAQVGEVGRQVMTHDDGRGEVCQIDRKSTRLNSSHGYISYAVFCLKKKKCARVSSSIRVRH